MKDFYVHELGEYRLFQTPNLWSTYQNYNYILAKGNEAWIFDPGELAPLHNTIEKNNLKLQQIFLTHHHPDHVGATTALQEKFDCPVMGHKLDEKRLPPLDRSYSAGEKIKIFDHQGEILFCPGHTLGLCVLYIPGLHLLFSNDLIFSLGCGRVFEGTYQQMYESLAKVRELPDETLVLCSHEYTQANLKFAFSVLPENPNLRAIETDIQKKLISKTPTVPTTLGYEKKNNPFLKWDDAEIRGSLELEDSQDWQVFAELRKRKDNF